MNVKIEKSELVEIEGLTEAAVASSDLNLIAIVRFADLASSYLSGEDTADNPMHPVHQLRESCIHELARRHGDDYSVPDQEGIERALKLCGVQV